MFDTGSRPLATATALDAKWTSEAFEIVATPRRAALRDGPTVGMELPAPLLISTGDHAISSETASQRRLGGAPAQLEKALRWLEARTVSTMAA